MGKTLIKETIHAKGIEIGLYTTDFENEFISLADIAKYRNCLAAAQVKLLAQAKKYERVNKAEDIRTHLLSGIVKCPLCGAGMYGNKSIKRKKDGTKYKDCYYYGCKHRTMTRGHKCDYKKQIREELLDDAVAEVIVKLVDNQKFAAMMQEKINRKVDTGAYDGEIADFEKQLRKYCAVKVKLVEEIDALDSDDRHYIERLKSRFPESHGSVNW